MVKSNSNNRTLQLFLVLFLLVLKTYSTVIFDPAYFLFDSFNTRDSSEPNLELKTVSIPLCTILSSPISGATGVPINSALSWNAASNATGYKLTVGTVSGGTDILDAFDVGNVLIYDLLTNLPDSTTIYVRITPYNLDSDALACGEEYFNTFAPNVLPPICTTLTNPLLGDIECLWKLIYLGNPFQTQRVIS